MNTTWTNVHKSNQRGDIHSGRRAYNIRAYLAIVCRMCQSFYIPKMQVKRGLTVALKTHPCHSGFFTNKKKPDRPVGLFNETVGWLTGLEPATTGITILDSTN